MPEKKEKAPTADERLEAIEMHLRNLDRRDRMRMVGGFLHSMLTLIPLVITLVSLWYLYNNWDTILKEVTSQAAEQAAQATQDGANGFMEQIKLMFPSGGVDQ